MCVWRLGIDTKSLSQSFSNSLSFYFVWMDICLHVCLCTMNVLSAHGSQVADLGLPVPEVTNCWSCHISDESWIQVLWKIISPNHLSSPSTLVFETGFIHRAGAHWYCYTTCYQVLRISVIASAMLGSQAVLPYSIYIPGDQNEDFLLYRKHFTAPASSL